MVWSYFIWFSLVSLLCWTVGAVSALRGRSDRVVYLSSIFGLLVFLSFIVFLGVSSNRLPLLTMGETRLLYSLFLPLSGIITYGRWRYKWILSFSTVLSAVFICINIFKPELHTKTLMPALRSVWFAPHVIVYMFAYALLGAAAVMAVYLLCKKKSRIEKDEISLTDDLVSSGLAFMTIGMLLGAVWAKDVWGHYWSWDPKETWAGATWLLYVAYIHIRLRSTTLRLPLCVLIFSFLCLQVCWWGINYLPSAVGASIHIYNIE